MAGHPGRHSTLLCSAPRRAPYLGGGRGGDALASWHMREESDLRLAVIEWLRQARSLPPVPQAITDVALADLPQWETLSNAVVHAAPVSDHRDLYVKSEGDRQPAYRVLLGQSGLGAATRLIAQGAQVPVEEIADSFVTFCTAPPPAVEDWLLIKGDFPDRTRIRLGRYTLQTFTPDEIRQMYPMPATSALTPGGLDLRLLAGAPFIHVPDPDRTSERNGGYWQLDFSGPRPEAAHWRALLPLILWTPELVHVDAVFEVERGREFGLSRVPTTMDIYEDWRSGREVEREVREAGDLYLSPTDLPGLEAFCTAVTAKIDAIMDGITCERALPRKRARRLERAARHLLQAHQRTHFDLAVWEQEVDELRLDYVIAVEALMVSPDDHHDDGNLTERICSRASALFLTPSRRDEVREMVRKAYSARSRYVHGDVLKDQDEKKKIDSLRALRLLMREIVLRWLILTPTGPEDLAPRLSAAAAVPETDASIDEALRAFFTRTPPHDTPVM